MEFAPDEISAAIHFIGAFPEAVNRVYVEVWEESGWVFAYGDERGYVPRLLPLVTRGRRFRVSGIEIVELPSFPSARFRVGPSSPR